MIKKLQKLNKKQSTKLAFIVIIFSIILIALVTTAVMQINKVIKKSKMQEIREFSYKIYSLNEDFDEAETVVTFQNEKEISSVTYINNENKEITIYPKNKNKVAIDLKMQDFHRYNFKVSFEDSTSNEYTLDFEIPRIKANYSLNNGIYVNEPDVKTGFSTDKTRYIYLDNNKNLVPGNWINGEKPDNWYNYKEQEWANIYAENDGIGSYYVWIPRYCYKIDNENSVSRKRKNGCEIY